MTEYLLVAAIVFGVNLMPAFGPPTWSVLVVLQVNLGLEPAILVPLGAISAASGRLILALGARHFRPRMSDRRLRGLDELKLELTANRGRSAAGVGLFLLSPLPSAQLFIAAGLMELPLRPLTLAFLAGRLVSYSIYVTAATVAASSLSELLGDSLLSPLGIALQLLMIGGLVLLVRIDWLKLLRGAGSDEAPHP